MPCDVLFAPPRFSIDLDIDAPKVAIPATDSQGAVVTQLLLDFGHFTLNTDQVRATVAQEEGRWGYRRREGGGKF